MNIVQTEYSKVKKDVHKILTSMEYFIGIILIIIGIIFAFNEVKKFYKIYEINKWPILKNAGTIYLVRPERKSVRNGKNLIFLNYSDTVYYHRIRVAFVYEINNQKYISFNLAYYEPWYENSLMTTLEEMYYQIGNKVNIRVNPSNFSEAYILNKPYKQYQTIIASIILIIFGIILIHHAK
ncbi:MAG: putative ORFan [Satyrvirus sp.]|uniref:Putative ORFan n=1 Tax=Satyrvirus sp. TaxID=2487771 RepID=A0A3G5ADH9_9VIRU|nr:MAG: putative ORFan [Satyrvirus sp.]